MAHQSGPIDTKDHVIDRYGEIGLCRFPWGKLKQTTFSRPPSSLPACTHAPICTDKCAMSFVFNCQKTHSVTISHMDGQEKWCCFAANSRDHSRSYII